MQIDPTKSYTATIVTEVGDIVLELFADKAPGTVNNFVFLSRDGYYDNITFHRVIANFMAQGGDPTGTGTGGPGYRFADEFHPDARHDAGVISMANAGPGTNGSQFFITLVPTPTLDGLNPDGSPKPCGNPGVSCHAVFGRVIGGQNAVAAIRLRDPASDPNPGTRIETIRITEE
ncbi:MAG: peptidylprolyl isomerase [Dehalococcoidia bacterium]|nr:peptidylprolyl isomerase [Dehalococcoidia bacterium]